VITDFEPMTAYLAHHYDLPLISIDNQHRIRYMTYPCPARLQKERRMTVSVIRAIVPKPDVSLVTTFFYGEAKNSRTFFFPPILRETVLKRVPSDEGHILVYLTSGFASFIKLLKPFSREKFLIYGYDRAEQDGHILYKPFSREGFLLDLAASKAVMATAGFTLMTEAFYLRKPYLALPMRGQFEQELNAFLMARLKYGINLRRIRTEAIGNFLYHLPDYRHNLTAYRAEDNSAIKDMLGDLLEDNCAKAKEFHLRRKN
jgi:uncharacterized protein (TIGR00661 family)